MCIRDRSPPFHIFADSDIAVDSANRIYLLGTREGDPGLSLIRISDAFDGTPSYEVVLSIADLGRTPKRFEVDPRDRLLVVFERSLSRYVANTTPEGIPFINDVTFAPPALVSPTDVSIDGKGRLYVPVREVADDEGSNDSDNLTSIQILNELGASVWSLCETEYEVEDNSNEQRQFDRFQRALAFTVDPEGCFYLWDDINWDDFEQGSPEEGSSTSHVLKIDPQESSGDEERDSCDD